MTTRVGEAEEGAALETFWVGEVGLKDCVDFLKGIKEGRSASQACFGREMEERRTSMDHDCFSCIKASAS